jgi:hypothetical protein
MKRRKTPQEKKANEYTKDHLVLKGMAVRVSSRFRRTWPRKKAIANRAYRRMMRQLSDAQMMQVDEDFASHPHPDTTTRERVRKWVGTVVPLGQIVQDRIGRRAISSAQSFFWHDYDTTQDRVRFSAFLQSRVAGRTAKSRLLALYLRELMEPANEGRWATDEWLSEKGQQWLHAFFRDEPEWEARVRAWISSFDDVQEES